MYVRALHSQTAAPEHQIHRLLGCTVDLVIVFFVLGRDADLDAKFLFFILNATVIVLPATWAQSS